MDVKTEYKAKYAGKLTYQDLNSYAISDPDGAGFYGNYTNYPNENDVLVGALGEKPMLLGVLIKSTPFINSDDVGISWITIQLQGGYTEYLNEFGNGDGQQIPATVLANDSDTATYFTDIFIPVKNYGEIDDQTTSIYFFMNFRNKMNSNVVSTPNWKSGEIEFYFIYSSLTDILSTKNYQISDPRFTFKLNAYKTYMGEISYQTLNEPEEYSTTYKETTLQINGETSWIHVDYLNKFVPIAIMINDEEKFNSDSGTNIDSYDITLTTKPGSLRTFNDYETISFQTLRYFQMRQFTTPWHVGDNRTGWMLPSLYCFINFDSQNNHDWLSGKLQAWIIYLDVNLLT